MHFRLYFYFHTNSSNVEISVDSLWLPRSTHTSHFYLGLLTDKLAADFFHVRRGEAHAQSFCKDQKIRDACRDLVGQESNHNTTENAPRYRK